MSMSLDIYIIFKLDYSVKDKQSFNVPLPYWLSKSTYNWPPILVVSQIDPKYVFG